MMSNIIRLLMTVFYLKEKTMPTRAFDLWPMNVTMNTGPLKTNSFTNDST